MNTIIENGNIMDITEREKELLLHKGMIYYCEECNLYHLYDGFDFGHINQVVGKLHIVDNQ